MTPEQITDIPDVVVRTAVRRSGERVVVRKRRSRKAHRSRELVGAHRAPESRFAISCCARACWC